MIDFLNVFFFGLCSGVFSTLIFSWLYKIHYSTNLSVIDCITIAMQKSLPYTLSATVIIFISVIAYFISKKTKHKYSIENLEKEYQNKELYRKDELELFKNNLNSEYIRKNAEKSKEVTALREKNKLLEKNQYDPRRGVKLP